MNNKATEPKLSEMKTRLIEVANAYRDERAREYRRCTEEVEAAWQPIYRFRVALHGAETAMKERQREQHAALVVLDEAHEALRWLNEKKAEL